MKTKIIILIAMIFTSCDSSTEQVSNCKKPAVVYSKYKPEHWYDDAVLIIRDADGNLISLNNDRSLNALIEKYQVGDTIK